MNSLGHRLWRLRWWSLAAAAVLTVVFGYGLSRLRINNDPLELLDRDDPELQDYLRFLDRFGHEAFVAVAFEVEDVFSPGTLRFVDRLSRRLREEIPGGESVLSLTEARVIRSLPVGDGEAELSVSRLIPRSVLAPGATAGSELEQARQRALADPLLRDSVVGAGGRATAVVLRLEPRSHDPNYVFQVTEAAERIAAEESRRSGRRLYLAGAPIFTDHYLGAVTRDLELFPPLTTLVMVLLLALLYRNARGVLLPAGVVLVGLIWTLGVIALAGSEINLVSTIIPPLILVIGVADVVHILNQYDEEAAAGVGRRRALQRAMTHITVPCLLTSLTTMVGFLSLASNRVVPVRETGLFSAFGVIALFVLAVVVSVAVLSRLKVPRRLARPAAARDWLVRLLERNGALVVRRPWWVLVGSAAIVVLSIWGATYLVVETNLHRYLRHDDPVVQAHEFMAENLAGVTELQLTITPEGTRGVKEPDTLRRMAALQSAILPFDEVGATTSLADVVRMLHRAWSDDDPAAYTVPDSAAAVAQLLLQIEGGDGDVLLARLATDDYRSALINVRVDNIGSRQLRALIERIETEASRIFDGWSGTRSIVGSAVIVAHIERFVVDGQIRSLGLALAVICVIMALALRSWKLGLISILPNCLPILLVWGVMGVAGIPINLATCMVPSISIGIAVDDTIHFLARYRREVLAGAEVSEAIRTTLRTTGRAMVTTSLVLTAGFLVILLSQFPTNVYFGVLCALTIAVALLGDLLLLPALLRVARPRL